NGSEFCAEDIIELTITDYNPDFTYTFSYPWDIHEVSYTASGAVTELKIAEAGTYEITLTAQTPYGCTLISNGNDEVIIKKAEFAGTFNHTEDGIDICVGETVPAIAFVPEDEEDDMPSGYIWMKGNTPVSGAT